MAHDHDQGRDGDAPSLPLSFPFMEPYPASRIKSHFAFLAMVAGIVVLTVGLADGPILSLTLDQTASRARSTLGLAEAILSGMLEKFVGLTQLVSSEPEIVDLVLNPDNPNAVRTANWFLKGRMVLLGAADIYVIGPDGTTLAASNFEGPVSFVGENFSYRPYFQDAMAGFFGRFFALGTTSGKRGYYFSAAIRVGSVARGVIVFKIDLDSIEETWRSEEYEVIVTDPDGIVFMASRDEWLYTTLEPLTPQLIERTAQTRRYDDAIIAQLPLRRVGAHGDLDVIEIASAGSGREYISVSEEMPLAGWTVSVLMDTAPARSQTLVILTAAGLFREYSTHSSRPRI